MPLTSKGETILRKMMKPKAEGGYGSEKKAKQVMYSMMNAGKLTGAHK